PNTPTCSHGLGSRTDRRADRPPRRVPVGGGPASHRGPDRGRERPPLVDRRHRAALQAAGPAGARRAARAAYERRPGRRRPPAQRPRRAARGRGAGLGRPPAGQPRAASSSVSFGRIASASPTTPTSANSKIGAFWSLLIATIVPALAIPTLCWMAPETPQAT